MKQPTPKQITRQEAGERLGLSLREIDRCIERGELRAFKHGRAVRIDLASVEQKNAADAMNFMTRAR